MQWIQVQIRDEVDCNVLLIYKSKIHSLALLFIIHNFVNVAKLPHDNVLHILLTIQLFQVVLNVQHNNNYIVQVHLSPGITSYTRSSSSFSLLSGGGGTAGKGWLDAEGVSYIPSRSAADAGPVLVGVGSDVHHLIGFSRLSSSSSSSSSSLLHFCTGFIVGCLYCTTFSFH